MTNMSIVSAVLRQSAGLEGLRQTAPSGGDKDKLPYGVAVVALEEGPELTTNIVDTEVTSIKIGMPVRIVISRRDEHKIHQASARV